MDAINEPATIQRAKQFLKDYHQWQLRKQSFSQWVTQPTKTMPQAARQADFECQLRLKTLAAMREVDQSTALLADLLTDRYINRLTIPQTVADLSAKYHQGYLAERTVNRYQNRALLSFAYACPRNLIVR
ncbi:hypothetical protein ACFQ22_07080 [Lentilactobacillus raoultii]|uniref:Integrase SAM-like N-terminal domain-containing protein n=1 Tax=Lentilactobacillus raoultii TaxID=1987503 RepID=A0ABW3PIF9_9LACO|nr:hypothetical protein [Lentilactobacillus raoultii]